MRLALTPSGLTMDRVRSSAIRFDLDLSAGDAVRESIRAGAVRRRVRASREVYLGSLRAGNVRSAGSAGKLRVFGGPDARPEGARGSIRAASSGLQTEKLSPQPHSPLTFGLRKRMASFSPCFTKSTIVPSDRKSTRLNSSHRCISYAVFCLK